MLKIYVIIKIKWMMQKHMTYENAYREDTIFCLPETSACVEGQGENAFLFYLHIFDRPEVYLFLRTEQHRTWSNLYTEFSAFALWDRV
jgi:hypothetical protein